MNLKKCIFFKRSLVYLGVVISKGLWMDLEKVKVIMEWPTLTSVIEVRRFYGLAIFYQKLVKNFNIITVPMTNYIREKEF